MYSESFTFKLLNNSNENDTPFSSLYICHNPSTRFQDFVGQNIHFFENSDSCIIISKVYLHALMYIADQQKVAAIKIESDLQNEKSIYEVFALKMISDGYFLIAGDNFGADFLVY